MEENLRGIAERMRAYQVARTRTPIQAACFELAGRVPSQEGVVAIVRPLRFATSLARRHA